MPEARVENESRKTSAPPAPRADPALTRRRNPPIDRPMKRRPLLHALAGLAFGLVLRQLCPAAQPASATPRHPLFLWQVTGDKGTVFLLGSLHAARADFYPLPRPIEQDFRTSSVLVEEIDLNRQDPARLRQLLLENGLYPPGDRLDDHISAATRQALQNYLKQTGQNPVVFSQMKPWLVSVLISGSVVASGGISGKYGIDEHFAQEAAAAHKPVAALESAQFQLDLLANLPARLQDAMLLSSLHDAQQDKREVATLLAAWRAGDAKPIEELIARDEREYPQLKPVYEELLPQRNRRMADKIAAYLATPKSYFVVVGIGHLIGDRGIVALLRDRKYRVERIDAQ
jgi:uncharacterized protein YbaP (TraB family)